MQCQATLAADTQNRLVRAGSLLTAPFNEYLEQIASSGSAAAAQRDQALGLPTSPVEAADYSNRTNVPRTASTASTSSSSDTVGGDFCWICLDGTRKGEPLVHPCKCPRKAHHVCLARWQLHCAGKEEEQYCRFCHTQLPDWRPAFLPKAATQPPSAYMRISYGGRSFKIKVQPGPDGERQFVQDCRKLLKIPSYQDFDVVFHCKEPMSGSDIRFRGITAYDAAVHCASVATPTKPKPIDANQAPTDVPGNMTPPSTPEPELEMNTPSAMDTDAPMAGDSFMPHMAMHQQPGTAGQPSSSLHAAPQQQPSSLVSRIMSVLRKSGQRSA